MPVSSKKWQDGSASVVGQFEILIRRRMIKINDIVTPSNNENILLIDNSCDVSIISNNSFLIETYTGTFLNVDGALFNMKSNIL